MRPLPIIAVPCIVFVTAGSTLSWGLSVFPQSPGQRNAGTQVTRAPMRDPNSQLTIPGNNFASIPVQAATARLITLKQGGAFRFGIRKGGQIKPGGTWNSAFGTISADGTYTVCRDFATNLYDIIIYVGPGGSDWYSFTVKVDRDPRMPLRAEPGDHPEDVHLIEPPTPEDAAAQPSSDPPLVFRDRVDLKKGGTETKAADIVSFFGDVPRTGLVLRADSPAISAGYTPKLGTVRPINPAPASQSPPVTGQRMWRTVPDPTQTFSRRYGQLNKGSVPATAELAATIKRQFNTDLQVGSTAAFGYYAIHQRRQYPSDYYRWDKNRWVLAGQIGGGQSKLAADYVPAWGAFIEGEPSPWSPLIEYVIL